MQVLIVDANASFDTSVVRTLRGYQLTTVSDMAQALTIIHETAFDCILVDIDTPPAHPLNAIAEIRQLVMTSAVVFLTDKPIQSLIEEALANGSIEVVFAADAIANISQLEQPVLLIGTGARPHVVQRLRDEQLRFSVATTLQFATNLLVDGWCQIVLLEVDIPGLTPPDKLSVFHRIDIKHLAILASAGSSSGITCSAKPSQSGLLISLLEHTAGSRPGYCGRQESSRKILGWRGLFGKLR